MEYLMYNKKNDQLAVMYFDSHFGTALDKMYNISRPALVFEEDEGGSGFYYTMDQLNVINQDNWVMIGEL